MRRRVATLVAVLAFVSTATAALSANPPRLVSMNVCTDQLVLALADPDQILGLSKFSRDGWQGPAAVDISRFPLLSGGAEDILLIKPDLVIASAFDKRATRELLKAKGLRLAELSVPRTLDEARRQIREVGDLLGHPERAAVEIARLDAALARARAAVADRNYRVLPLSRRGWVAGSDSFVGSLLGEAGLRSAASDLGFAFGGFAPLETIVQLRPDFIVVARAGNVARDDGQAFLLHPALQRFYPPEKRIVIPERMTECGGVMLADALDALAGEIERVGRRRFHRVD